MNLKLNLCINVLLIFLQQNVNVKAALYAFLIEDPDIFQDCKNEPNYLGVADMVDLSNLQIEVLDDAVHIEGSVTMLWDADPNDRVELQSDIFKYERGSWQPTVFTMIQNDFCRTFFEKSSIWYQTWTQFVEPDDLKCITNKGHTYHHTPFDLETVVDIKGEDVSGKHKVVIKIDAYDQMRKKQPYSVCLEVVGDVIKK